MWNKNQILHNVKKKTNSLKFIRNKLNFKMTEALELHSNNKSITDDYRTIVLKINEDFYFLFKVKFHMMMFVYIFVIKICFKKKKIEIFFLVYCLYSLNSYAKKKLFIWFKYVFVLIFQNTMC